MEKLCLAYLFITIFAKIFLAIDLYLYDSQKIVPPKFSYVW